MNKTITLSAFVIMLALIFTVAGIVFKQTEAYVQSGHTTIASDSESTVSQDNKIIPDTLYDFIDTYEDGLDDFYSKKIYWDDFTNNIAILNDTPYIIKTEMFDLFQKTLFDDNKGYTITNFLNKMLNERISKGPTITGSYYSAALVSLRYKQLIPYMTDKLLSAEKSANITVASWCVTWFGYINHPDKLKLFLLLDKEIPEDSPIRNQSIPVWPDPLSLIYRPDCLDLYLDISGTPEQWKFHNWHRASLMLAHFTNDTAVAGLSNAYITLKNSKNYWKERHDTGLNVYHYELSMKEQQDRISGKRTIMDEPPPLLDE